MYGTMGTIKTSKFKISEYFLHPFSHFECTYHTFVGLRVCLVQFASQGEITKTLNHLEEMVAKAVATHYPDVIAFPECFNFEYCTEPSVVKAKAESINDGATNRRLSELSKKYSIFIVGGSIERDGDKLYNTANAWGPNGELLARHQKVCRS